MPAKRRLTSGNEPTLPRCSWLNEDPLYIAYHDEEWGVPQRDAVALFECLLLEGAQAGLSWYTILKKRENYREAFDGFDPARMARFTGRRVERLVQNPGIVRHRGKIEAFIGNARAFLDLHDSGTDFVEFVWSSVGGEPVQRRRRRMADVPSKTAESESMSRELKKRGFRFVGATTCYAFMQATGMVNDHVTSCFRHAEIAHQWRRDGCALI